MSIILIGFDGKEPQIGNEVFMVSTAVLVDDVQVGDKASIWFGAVLWGDFGGSIITTTQRTIVDWGERVR